ncbi:MAG: PKD domain-containing protein [Bacteroidetes bacterium]|nr:PKD domain-containing protein [Bacteroidota bacterium]
MKGTFALLLLLLFGCIQKSEAQCTVVILGNSSTCSGQSTRLIAKVTGGNPTSFTWTSTPAGVYTNNDTIFVSPTVATNYVVTVSGNGCSANDAFSMAILPLPPVPSFTFGPDSVCSGAPVSFSASPTGGGVTFSWNFGDGRTGTGANVSHKFYSYGNGSGSFNVTLTIKGANGCTRSVTQTVKVIQRPHAVLTPAAGTDTLTFDGFVTFYKCITNQQTSAVFNFRNAAVPAGGVNYTILWGDTGVPFITSTPWATIAHTYGLGIFTITYIVSNPTSGCSDTTYYKAFFGSNPAGGIATLGSTTICGPASLAFILTNYQSNPPGTLYTITFNDSSTSLTFPHPPPDTIFHLFDRTSCGTTSSNGISNFGNAFGAFLIVTNPCGVTSGSVLPIYVSMSPKANFVVSNNFTACVNTDATIINTSINGQAVSNGSCNSTTYLLWNVSPPTGWTLTGGSMGSDNGYIGNNYDPTGWSTGSSGLNVRFTTIGTYQMRLVVANNCGKPDTIIKNVCVSGPPTPSFTLPSNIGCAPYVVIPNNTTPSTGSCSSINYIWNPAFLSATCLPDSLTYFEFVNGTTNQSASPRLRLNNQGLYQLSLTAQNVCGSFTTPAQNITVKDRPELSVDIPAGICGGDHFTASSSALACGSTISGYSWTFQGGTPATASVQNPGNISMTTPGFHLVSVSATSECGVMRIDTSIVVDTIPQAKPGADTSVCGGLPIRIGATLIPGYIYAWSPSLGLDDTTVSAPTANLTNNSDTVFRQTYMLIAGVTGCKDTASVVVSIYPPALANAGGAYSVCSGDSVVLNGSISGGATSALWTSLDGIFRPTDSLTTHFTPSIISGSTTVTLTSNDPAGPCPAVVANSSVTINDLPLVSNSPLSQTVCSGAVSQTVILTSSIPGTTYTWTASSSDGVTGFIANGTTDSIPSQFFTNSSDSSGHVVYVITPSFGNCTGPVANYVFTISPVPDVILPAPQTICSGASFNMVSLTSSTIGTTFRGHQPLEIILLGTPFLETEIFRVRL